MKEACIISVLEACSSCNQALQIHARFILTGLHRHTIPLSRLLAFFALSPAGSLPHSHLILSHAPRPNLFMYNTLIRAHSRTNTPEPSLVLYKQMIAGLTSPPISPNKYTFSFLINGCAGMGSLDGGSQVHLHVVKFGVDSDVFVGNGLIHCYCRFGEVGVARRVFDEMCERDVVSYNTMIGGLARHCRISQALELFRVMGDYFSPDGFTLVSLLGACSVAEDYNLGRLVHLFVYKYSSVIGDGYDVGVVKAALLDMYVKGGMVRVAERVFLDMGDEHRSAAAWSSMITGYVRCGEIEMARRLFNNMPGKDVVSWTAMISACAQAGHYKEALEIYKEMGTQVGIEPDEMTMSSVLSAAAHLGALDVGKQVHERVKKGSFGYNSILYTAIVDMYAKSGSVEDALEVFNAVPEGVRTVSLFNSIISGLAKHGLAMKALEVFSRMKILGLKPDRITFTGILSACSHGSLVIDGKKLFKSMVEEFELEPETEHYCCMVDLLGRCGLLHEAYDFIEKMPIQANSIIWGALLSACRIHENVEIGKLVGQRIIEVGPKQGGTYVQLSSMYATAKQWEEAQLLRGQLDVIGIHKPAGWSSVELNGSLHQFVAGDLNNSGGKEIKAMLDEMSSRLKSVNHSSDTTQVSYDIDNEEKELLVSRHSERLALAFALVHLSKVAIIRIMKNLRICRDCHASFKIFSKSFAREIVVRDRIRFHHFKDGFCSCGDFW